MAAAITTTTTNRPQPGEPATKDKRFGTPTAPPISMWLSSCDDRTSEMCHLTRGRRPECVLVAVTNRTSALERRPRAVYAHPMAQAEAGVVAVASTPFTRSRTRLGLAVFIATTAVCLLAAVVDWHAGRARSLVYVGVAEVLALLGVLLTTRMAQHRISWVIAAGGLWWGISALVAAYAVEALVTDPGSLPGGLVAAVVDSWAWLPGLAVFLCVLLVLMPDGRLSSRRWWPVLASVTVGTVMLAVVASTDSSFTVAANVQVSNPLALRNRVVDALAVSGFFLVLGGLGGSLAAFAVRYRQSHGVEKQQLRWVGVSLGLSVTLAVLGALTWDFLPAPMCSRL